MHLTTYVTVRELGSFGIISEQRGRHEFIVMIK